MFEESLQFESRSDENGNECVPKNLKILVIDDDFADFFAIKRMLGQSMERIYSLTHIDNFDDGLAALKDDQHDAVLIDHHLGNRLGVEILGKLKGELNFPAVILTGSNDRAVEVAALKAGAFDFLDKNAMTSATLVRSLDFAISRFSVEQKIREKQHRLRRACENAEAAHFSKSEFLEFLSSELRTPLNAIIGFSQVMKQDSLAAGMPDAYRAYSETVHASGTQLMEMIEDLLDPSKENADSFDARRRRFQRYRTWVLEKQDGRRDAIEV